MDLSFIHSAQRRKRPIINILGEICVHGGCHSTCGRVYFSKKNDQLYLELKMVTVNVLKGAKTTGFLIIIGLFRNKASQYRGHICPDSQCSQLKTVLQWSRINWDVRMKALHQVSVLPPTYTGWLCNSGTSIT